MTAREEWLARNPYNAKLPPTERRILRSVQESLSWDLLTRKLQGELDPELHFTRGHCYIATEAAYYLHFHKQGYRPYYARCEDGGTHWWLVNGETGELADPTEPQTNGEFNYEAGSPQGFQQPSPCKRTRELMRRVRARWRDFR